MGRQRIRPLLLFKKKTGMFQRVRANLWALPNRLQSTTLGQIRAVSGSVDGADKVNINFTKEVAGTCGLGVTITVNTLQGVLTAGESGFLRGFRPVFHPTSQFGTLTPDALLGLPIYQLTAGNTDIVQLRLGVDGNQQHPTVGAGALDLTVNGIPYTLTWNGTDNRYDATIVGSYDDFGAILGSPVSLSIGAEATFTCAINLNTITYTLTSQIPIPDGAAIIWTYVPGDLAAADDPTDTVEATTLNFSAPVAGANAWGTETAGRWKQENSDNWILEAQG